MKPVVGVVLCGCGRFDGSEVHESVLTLLHLRRAGAEVRCFAPDAPQWATCEHFDGSQEGEPRNMLKEAARIARGEVESLSVAQAGELDALILPGGSGAVHNLCSFANLGAEGRVIPELQALLEGCLDIGLPIGAICIAPAILALAFPGLGLRMTLGDASVAPATIAAACGAQMIGCAVDEIVVDQEHKVVSTPAYILGPDIAAVDQGIEKLVTAVLELVD